MAFEKGKPRHPSAGRRKGSRNKVTAKREAKIAESGLTPLDYMMRVLRNEKASRGERMDAAKGAAPYVHPRLAAVEHSGPGGGPIPFQRIERVVVDPAHPDG